MLRSLSGWSRPGSNRRPSAWKAGDRAPWCTDTRRTTHPDAPDRASRGAPVSRGRLPGALPGRTPRTAGAWAGPEGCGQTNLTSGTTLGGRSPPRASPVLPCCNVLLHTEYTCFVTLQVRLLINRPRSAAQHVVPTQLTWHSPPHASFGTDRALTFRRRRQRPRRKTEACLIDERRSSTESKRVRQGVTSCLQGPTLPDWCSRP